MAVLALCIAASQAAVLIRAPAHDSAIIRSDRLGGNFAYSIHEGHAYAQTLPIVQHIQTPVAVSYSAPLSFPSTLAYHAIQPAQVEVKTVETPEIKALPLTYGFPGAYSYGAYPYGAFPGAYTIVKAAEKSE